MGERADKKKSVRFKVSKEFKCFKEFEFVIGISLE